MPVLSAYFPKVTEMESPKKTASSNQVSGSGLMSGGGSGAGSGLGSGESSREDSAIGVTAESATFKDTLLSVETEGATLPQANKKNAKSKISAKRGRTFFLLDKVIPFL